MSRFVADPTTELPQVFLWARTLSHQKAVGHTAKTLIDGRPVRNGGRGEAGVRHHHQ